MSTLLKNIPADGPAGAENGGLRPIPAPPGGTHLRSRSWWITAAYAALATLWIFSSDYALGLLSTDPAVLVKWSVYKGVAFVVVTSVLLFVLVRRAFGTIESGYAALQAKEAEIMRLNRLYAALSQVNQAIVWMPTRDELFRKVCRVLVEHGGFRMAWIGWHDPESRRLDPLAVWGGETGSVRSVDLPADAGSAGQAPAARAFRENRPYISNDFHHDPATASWREEAGRLGIRACAAFPIRHAGEVAGVLSVYAGESGFFHDREIALLVKAATDMTFALDNFARDAERRRAEAEANRERLFSNAMIESMPGIVYFYDAAGRFLRWNRNFETVSGYSAEEIARMHPLDFFAAAHKPRLEQRIGEVFEKGESSIEAPFLARDGRAIPYFFTGRRVVFDGLTCLVGVGIDISERTKAEVALRESEERFHAFMDATPAIAWVTDEAGRHLYMNKAWDEAFGLNRAEWLGKTAFDLVPGPAAERIRQSDAAVLQGDRAIEIAEDTGELRGRRFYWNCIKFPFRNAAGRRFVGGIAIDITERKRAERALRELQGRLEIVVENLREGLVIADPDGELLHWNPASLRLLGFADPEEGRRLQREFSQLFELTTLDGTVIPPSEWPLARARRGEHFQEFEARVRRLGTKDGRIISYDGALVNYAGSRVLAFVTLQDITERKEAERLLRDANTTLESKVAERTAELEAAVARAEAADRIKSAFLATMSHELRTPLNSIIGFTGIILQGLAGPLNPEQTKQLGMVRGSARHLLELINDVLDISKIEAAQLEVRSEPFSLPESLERMVASVRPLAEKKGLALDVALAPGLGEMVSDQRRFEQILLNLLNNSLKFTEQGGVTLTTSLRPDYRPAPEAAPRPAVCLRVSDTGIGIKPEDLATLFQPFRQVDSGLGRQHEGTGLGLAICRRLAGLLGGEITAASEWSRGSVFTVILPLVNPPAS